MTIRALLVASALVAALSAPAWPAETPGKRGAGGVLPKGSYSSSCACKFSGGVELACFCANLHAKWFRTVMDVRSCLAPADIKNCEGVLTCTESTAAICPAPGPASTAAKK
jgi:hypothetical protein